jgi:predicted small lipoprotein YifL
MKTETNPRLRARRNDRCDARAADTGLRPIHRPIGPLAFAMLLMIASLVAACGNKGPLVKPNATSPPPPATTPATPVAPAATDGS